MQTEITKSPLVLLSSKTIIRNFYFEKLTPLKD